MRGRELDGGLICARSSDEDYSVLIPMVPESVVSTEVRVGAVRIKANAQYVVQLGEGLRTGTFLRVSLQPGRSDLLAAFVSAIWACLPENRTAADSGLLTSRLTDLLQLLQGSQAVPATAVKGLWAEIWLIANSADPERLCGAWQDLKQAKVDFYLGSTFIVVKCHEGAQRLHHFRLDQLLMKSDETYVVSVCVAASPTGNSIRDLISKFEKLVSEDMRFKVWSGVAAVLGPDFEVAFDYSFEILDEAPAIALPAIRVPRPIVDDRGVRDVTFVADLSDAALEFGMAVEELLAMEGIRSSQS
jgi:hypothetical protein